MDLGLGNINVNELPQGDNFDPIPAGWYQAQVDKAEVKPTKAGNGSYLNVTYKVMGPSHAGRVVFGMVTLKNPNAEAERIGRQNLGDLCRACGLVQIQNSDPLIGKTLEIKVAVKKSEEYDDKNEVKGYRAISGPASGPIGGPAQAPPAQSGGSTAPWNR